MNGLQTDSTIDNPTVYPNFVIFLGKGRGFLQHTAVYEPPRQSSLVWEMLGRPIWEKT